MKPVRWNATPGTLWILGAPALALAVTAAFMLTDASPDWIQAVWLASIVQTVSASFLQTLWKGLNHGDWSAFT